MKVTELSLDSVNGFHQVYLKYNKLVRHIVFPIVGEPYVDDIVQESFVRAWRSRSNFKNESTIKTWICRIAVNVSIDHQRKSKVRKGTSNTFDMEVFGADKNNEFLEAIILEAISQLKPHYRSAFVIVALEGFSTKEASEILQIGEGTLRSRVSKARSQLRSYLKEKGVTND